jgi:triosephosphate isomerase
MSKVIVGNWKMNGSKPMATKLVPAIASYAAGAGVKCDIVLCPPALFVPLVATLVQGSFLALGAQDCSAKAEGAYTGETSATMLLEHGCRYVIVGHSERRQYHAETDSHVEAKAEAALKQGLIPIVCVGETLEQREAGDAQAVVAAQIDQSVPKAARPGEYLLAYEPVWAIGTGKVASSDDIAQMHQHIATLLPGTKILYGGSVKAANAQEILQLPGVSGVLVGGASLILEEFCAIIAAAG